jgi:hypothetical protein
MPKYIRLKKFVFHSAIARITHTSLSFITSCSLPITSSLNPFSFKEKGSQKKLKPSPLSVKTNEIVYRGPYTWFTLSEEGRVR